jgi:hypothetical protein
MGVVKWITKRFGHGAQILSKETVELALEKEMILSILQSSPSTKSSLCKNRSMFI